MPPESLALIIVDHGSRREESNELLLKVVAEYRGSRDFAIVEPAHMELAEPSIATAVDRCAEQGAKLIVVFPYFLSPGRHWRHDIPSLTEEAVAEHEGLRFVVTAPFGMHPLMSEVIDQRVAAAIDGE
ncbi:MAG: sirohydrochlorin ferrochelatase [Pirellulaceae bacterium]|jgi:sirohydrochlorin ferrochelatase